MPKLTDPDATVSVEMLCTALAEIAPLGLAESWDNVGLLVGDRSRSVSRLMTCLTISPDVVEEACGEGVQLVVTHHPLPFKPLSRLTADSLPGRLLLQLVGGGIAVYSAHTAFDSARSGINQMWAEALGLRDVRCLLDREPAGGDHDSASLGGSGDEPEGSGRYGDLTEPLPLATAVRKAAGYVGATGPRLVGNPERPVRRIGIVCGSGGSFLAAAGRRGCELLLTGEASFHTCLEAESMGIGLGLLGHYWSERFAMERLAEALAARFPTLLVWPSRRESDPLRELGG